MPEQILKCEPIKIHELSIVGLEDEEVKQSGPDAADDVRHFLLSVTGSDLLAHGEMLLR